MRIEEAGPALLINADCRDAMRAMELACEVGFGGQLRNTHAVKLKAFYYKAQEEAIARYIEEAAKSAVK